MYTSLPDLVVEIRLVSSGDFTGFLILEADEFTPCFDYLLSFVSETKAELLDYESYDYCLLNLLLNADFYGLYGNGILV
jgi:hypothetical protein